MAGEIGTNALAVQCNCLDKQSIVAAKKEVNEKFGSVNFLINGAGGNNPRATCDNETMTPDTQGIKDFFKLEESGIKFVFDPQHHTAFLVTQVFAEDMIKNGRQYHQYIQHGTPTVRSPRFPLIRRRKRESAISRSGWRCILHPADPCECDRAGFFVTNQNRALLFDEAGKPTARTEKILAATPMKKFGGDLRSDRRALVAGRRRGKRFVTGTVIPIDGGFSAYSGV